MAALVGLSFLMPLPTADDAIDLALSAETQQQWQHAATYWHWAAARDPQLTRFLRYRALRAVLLAGTDAPNTVAGLAAGAETWGYAGSALAAVQADAQRSGGLPTVSLTRAALQGADHDAVCEFMTPALRAALDTQTRPDHFGDLVDLHHGECSDTVVPSLAAQANIKPTAEARVRRAERLHAQVRFFATVAEIESLGDLNAVEPLALRCRAWFRAGRALYRIRKRRNESEPMFAKVVANCEVSEAAKIRRQSLYAVGKRRYELDDMGAASTAFATLLKDYPQSSHADDAVFYLARIARKRGKHEDELALLARAEADYPDGDMFAEIIWEVLEPYYRAGDFQKFIDAVDAVKRPPRDDQYYSQGRLSYFTAQAALKLGRKDEAARRFAVAWRDYPWSFYGYLSRMRLVQMGEVPADPKVDPSAVAPWIDSPAYRLSAAGRLFEREPSLAASLLDGTQSDHEADKWRRAYVYDAAKRHDVSHNIVRRQIGGRPWSEPLSARLTQWTLAWPDPFGGLVDDAVAAEQAQQPKVHLLSALPRAIMREESSFIEDIESYAGALGLMQLMPRTALGHDDDVDGPATPERLKTARVNVRVGVDHLFWLSKVFDGHPVLIVAAYNAGNGNVKKWLKQFPNDDIALFIEDIPVLQTRGYTKRVIGSYAAYQWLVAKEQPLDDTVLTSP